MALIKKLCMSPIFYVDLNEVEVTAAMIEEIEQLSYVTETWKTDQWLMVGVHSGTPEITKVGEILGLTVPEAFYEED